MLNEYQRSSQVSSVSRHMRRKINLVPPVTTSYYVGNKKEVASTLGSLSSRSLAGDGKSPLASKQSPLASKPFLLTSKQALKQSGKPLNCVSLPDTGTTNNSVEDSINNDKDSINNDKDSKSLKHKQSSIIPRSVEHRMVPVVLKFLDVEFLLIQLDEDQVSSNPQIKHLTPLFDDPKILEHSIGELFEIIRTDDDLLEMHEFTEYDELVLRIPELDDITITEDNIYCRNILINDFTKVLNALVFKTRNYGDLESVSLHLEITSQPRFITNFNNLNDLIRLGYGLDRIAYRKKLYDNLTNTSDVGKEQDLNKPNDTNDHDDPNDTNDDNQLVESNPKKKQKTDS